MIQKMLLFIESQPVAQDTPCYHSVLILNIIKCSALFAESFLTTTSSPGHFPLALEVGQEKALASASHMTTKNPECVGVLNQHTIAYDLQQNIEDSVDCLKSAFSFKIRPVISSSAIANHNVIIQGLRRDEKRRTADSFVVKKPSVSPETEQPIV